MGKFSITLFTDILKEKAADGRILYSQGRVYLFLSVIVYYATIGLMACKSMKPDMNINMDVLKQVIEALQWFVLLMAGYVFGGKFLDAAKVVMSLGKGQAPAQNLPAASDPAVAQ